MRLGCYASPHPARKAGPTSPAAGGRYGFVIVPAGFSCGEVSHGFTPVAGEVADALIGGWGEPSQLDNCNHHSWC